MAAAIEKKYKNFIQDSRQRTRFERLICKLPLTAVLWPYRCINSFPREFQALYKNRRCIFPLEILEDRIHYVKIKLEQIEALGHKELHPILSFYFLSLFQEQLSSLKRKSKKNNKTILIINKKIEKLKKNLDVPSRMKHKQNSLTELLLSEFQAMAKKAADSRQKNAALEAEISAVQTEFFSKTQDTALTKLQHENQGLRLYLKQEHTKAARLGRELKRITEQILAFHHLDKNSSLYEEYQELRQEYNLLTRKNDTLVSKNIELSNRVEASSCRDADKLENILDTVRERINVLLKKEYTDEHGVLLLAIKKEISQLTRARIYLGRALYNLGMLYLRIGESKQGLEELRAAKELGIHDAKVNELIKSLS